MKIYDLMQNTHNSFSSFEFGTLEERFDLSLKDTSVICCRKAMINDNVIVYRYSDHDKEKAEAYIDKMIRLDKMRKNS